MGEQGDSVAALGSNIPIRMRRPPSTRETLGFAPLVETGWADASGVKGVPLVPTSTEPFVFLAGRPAAERATDARRLRLARVLLFKLAIPDRFRGVGHHRSSSHRG